MSTDGKREQIAMVVTIVVIEFISGFTQGFYEPLIPKFGEAMGVDASGLQLFNVFPTAIAALFVPVLTRLGDIKGYRKLLRLVIPMVFVATVIIWLGALLNSWPLVLVGRVLNGPIAVWLPLHIALVHSRSQGNSATTAVSAIVATMTLGTVVGTACSGFLFNALGNLQTTVIIIPVLQFIAVLLVIFVMPEFVSGADSHIDVRGFVLLGLIMLLAIFGFVEVVEGGMESAIGAALIVAALVVGVFWFRYQKRIEHPAIDVRIMFSRKLFPLYIGAICYGAVFYGFMSPTATFLAADPLTNGYGFAFDPSNISIAQTSILLATVVAALIVPVLVKTLKPKLALMMGFILAAAAFAQWAIPGPNMINLIIFIVLSGLGLGVVSAAIPVIIPDRATKDTKGIATGLFNSSQTLGGALGGGLFISLLKVGATSSGVITSVGYTTVWATCAGILLLGLAIVAVFLTKNDAD